MDALGAFIHGPVLMEKGSSGGPLSGVGFAVKDLFDVAGQPTGAGNPDWLADAPVAEAHAPAVSALLNAGADLWGKTITDELAFSLAGTNVHYGTPVNSRAPGRAPGGSSSGSASAVAGAVVALALGTDTAGSVRVPASYCGIFGLRPSHGRVDAGGVVPLAPSFDTVGLLAANGGALARAWGALRDGAPGEPGTSTPGRTIRRLVIAPDLLAFAEPDTQSAVSGAADALGRGLGYSLITASLGQGGDLDRWRDAFRVMQLAEVWATHGDWVTRRRPRFGPGVADRFAQAARADPETAGRAQPVRGEVAQALALLLGDDGVLVQPAAVGPAPPAMLGGAEKDDLRRRLVTLTAPAGLAGAPVVVLPAAELGGLPVGLALVGLPGDDDALVQVAKDWTSWRSERP